MLGLGLLLLLGADLSPIAGADSAAYLSCDGQAAERTISLSGTVTLNRHFIPAGELASPAALAAVEAQLKYVRAAYLYPETASNRFLPSAAPAKITVLSIAAAKYPSAFTLTPIAHPDVTIEGAYVKAALQRGKTETNDEAVTIRYAAEMRGLFCARASTHPTAPAASANGEEPTLELRLPSDPYLAYWSVGAAEFRKIHWKYAEFTINPCADAELADLPHPEYYWYFYRPEARGRDADGRPFDCRERLQAGVHFQMIPAHVLKSPEVPAPPSPLRFKSWPVDRPLRGTVIFGVIDPSLTQVQTPSGTFASVRVKMAAFLRSRGADRGSRYFAGFLTKLDETFEPHSIRLKRADGLYRVSAHLKRSHRAVEFDLYFGPTDVLAGRKPGHWNAMARSIARQDFLIYNGHSGLGENYSLENLKKFARGGSRTLAADKAPAYRLIAYLSCYSYSYFKRDLVDEIQARGAGARVDVMTTASEFTSERGPLGVFDLMDREASGWAQTQAGEWTTPYFNPADALLVHAF